MTTVPIVTRKQWGARYANGEASRPVPFTEYWLHHDVSGEVPASATLAVEIAHVQLLERIGQQRFGAGISYTYPVMPSGRLFEGHTYDRRGTHTGGHNTPASAFVLAGDYSRKPMTAAQIETIARRMVEDHRAGRSTLHQLTGGHRDAARARGVITECPGDRAYSQIGDVNRRARELWATGYPNRAPAPLPTPHPMGGKTMHQLVRLSGQDAVWLSDLITRRWVTSPAELKVITAQLKARGLPAGVTVVTSLEPYGVVVGKVPA